MISWKPRSSRRCIRKRASRSFAILHARRSLQGWRRFAPCFGTEFRGTNRGHRWTGRGTIFPVSSFLERLTCDRTPWGSKVQGRHFSYNLARGGFG